MSPAFRTTTAQCAALIAPYGLRSLNAGNAISRRLADPPEERQRPFHDPAHVPAPGLVLQKEAGRRVHRVLEGGAVEAAHRGFFLIEACGIVPGFDRGLDLGARRPAEPCLFA